MITRASDRRDPGFTLAETLIALTVLGVAGFTATALLAHLARTTVDSREDVRRHALAAAVMESVLTVDYVDLDLTTTAGVGPDDETWTVTVSDEDDDLKRIRVEVDGGGRTTRLETLISDR